MPLKFQTKTDKLFQKLLLKCLVYSSMYFSTRKPIDGKIRDAKCYQVCFSLTHPVTNDDYSLSIAVDDDDLATGDFWNYIVQKQINFINAVLEEDPEYKIYYFG